VAPLIYFAFYGTLKPGNAGATHPHPSQSAQTKVDVSALSA
jgi:hypothetical protein